jgi:hypothetical protein
MKMAAARWLVPALVAGLTAVAAAVTAALVLAIVDLYLTGHGHVSIARPWISWSPFVELSRADAILLVAAALAALTAFLTTKRYLPGPRTEGRGGRPAA